MSYLILARKYRPQRFADLTGQETTARILQSAILQDRAASAYLFSGTRGTGKTTTARIFAKTLNCKNPGQAEPCNACASCEEIAKGSSIDVLEMDAASHTQVDNIREVVINTVGYAPVRDRRKVFIIDEVHMLSNHSFNALLKTLEEPPAHVLFILATTEFHKIPQTIASRCQRFRFLPLSPQQIFETLRKIAGQEAIAIEDPALALLARSAGGSMRDALSLFDQVISHLAPGRTAAPIGLAAVEDVLGVVREEFLVDFLGKIADRDPRAVLELTDRFLKEGYDLSYFLKELREGFRSMLVEKCGFRERDSWTLKKLPLPTERFSRDELLRAAQLLSQCADQMRWNDFPRFVFECHAVRLCQGMLDAARLLERLETLERGGPPQAAAAAEPVGKPGDEALPARRPLAPPPPQPIAPKPEPPAAAGAGPATQAERGRAAEPGAQAEAAAAVLSAEPGTAPAGSELDWHWRKVLEQVQERKPSLYASLESARVRREGGKLEVSFARAFSLDAARRNAPLIDAFLREQIRSDFTLELRLAEPAASPARPPVPLDRPLPPAALEKEEEGDEAAPKDDDTVVIEEPSVTREGLDHGEVFRPIDTSPSAVEDALEDEGLKRFLKFFHGKVTRLPDGRP